MSCFETQPSWLSGSNASLFHLPLSDVISDLHEVCFEEKLERTGNQFSTSEDNEVEPTIVSSTKLSCIVCDQVFTTRTEQVDHFKSDEHRSMLQKRLDSNVEGNILKQKSNQAANEEEDKGQSDESSDSDNNEEPIELDMGELLFNQDQHDQFRNYKWWLRHGQPTICFSNSAKTWAIEFHISLLTQNRKEFYDHSTIVENVLKNSLCSLNRIANRHSSWCIILLRSGRFAGGIFQGDQLVYHKTFKRYTVRRGQGGSQSSKDASGKKPKSAGAMLRRHGEEQLREDTRSLLRDQWGSLINSCSLVFYSCPRTMLPILFGNSSLNKKDAPLSKQDQRLRLAACGNRPSLQEVKDMHKKLSSVEFYDLADKVQNILPPPPPPPAPPVSASTSSRAQPQDHGSSSSSAESSKDETVEPIHMLFHLLDMADVEGFKYELLKKENKLPKDDDDEDETEERLSTIFQLRNENGLTLLHVASEKNDSKFVSLCLDYGADPRLLDYHSRPPYYLTTSKDVREVYRKYRAQYPLKFNHWLLTQVPEPLTNEMILKKKEKDKEKKKKHKENLKLKKKILAENVLKEQIEKEKQEEIELKEKLRQEEALRVGSICDGCSGPIKKGNCFNRLSYQYCSPACVQSHRRSLMTAAAENRMNK